jgi:hypothetical protein
MCFFSTARKSLSYDNIQRAKSFTSSESTTSGPTTTTSTAGPKLRNKSGPGHNKYDHVQSKVRKYIDGYSNSRAGSVGRTANDDDVYGRSFILSPGEHWFLIGS